MPSPTDLDYQTLLTPIQMGQAPRKKVRFLSPQARLRSPRQEHDSSSVNATATRNTMPSSTELPSTHGDFIYISSDESSDEASDVDEVEPDELFNRTMQDRTPTAERTESPQRLLFKADDANRYSCTGASGEDRETARRCTSLPLPGHQRIRSPRPRSCEPTIFTHAGSSAEPPVIRALPPATTLIASPCISSSSTPDFWDHCASQTSYTSLSEDDINAIEARLSSPQPSLADNNVISTAQVPTSASRITSKNTKALASSRPRRFRSSESPSDHYPRRSTIEIPIKAVDDDEYCPSPTDMESDADSEYFSDGQLPPRKRRQSKVDTSQHEYSGGRLVCRESDNLDHEQETLTPVTQDQEPAADAAFDEWTLSDVVLKRTIVGGRATFQLEFGWDMCHQHERGASQRRRKARRESASATIRSARRPFTPEEEQFIIEQKDKQAQKWSDIHQRFCKKFTRRSQGSLQVHYCNKLKKRSGSLET